VRVIVNKPSRVRPMKIILGRLLTLTYRKLE